MTKNKEHIYESYFMKVVVVQVTTLLSIASDTR